MSPNLRSPTLEAHPQHLMATTCGISRQILLVRSGLSSCLALFLPAVSGPIGDGFRFLLKRWRESPPKTISWMSRASFFPYFSNIFPDLPIFFQDFSHPHVKCPTFFSWRNRRRPQAPNGASRETSWWTTKISCSEEDFPLWGIVKLWPKHDGFGWIRTPKSQKCRIQGWYAKIDHLKPTKNWV